MPPAYALGVFNVHQTQCLSRSDWPCCSSVFCFKNFTHLFWFPSAFADFDEGADDISDHIIQEAVTFYINIHPIIILANIAAKNSSY